MKITEILRTSWKILALSFPLLLSLSGNVLLLLTDRISLAAFSSATLSASGPAVFTTMISLMFFIGTGSIARAIVSEKWGERESAQHLFHELCLQIALSIILSLMFVLTVPLLLIVNTIGPLPEITKSLVSQYILFSILFGPPMIFNSLLSCYFSGIGKVWFVFLASFVGQIVGAASTIVLVFGYVGFVPLGMAGAAIGTLVGATITLFVFCRRVPASTLSGTVELLRRTGTLSQIKRRLSLGVPLGLQRFFDELSAFLITLVISTLGVAMLSANNVNIIISYLFTIPIIGLSNGVTIVLSNHLSRKDYGAVMPIAISGLVLGLSYTFVLAVLTSVYAQFLINVVIGEISTATILNIATSVSKIVWIYGTAFCCSTVLGACLQSFGETRFYFRCRFFASFLLSVPTTLVLTYFMEGSTDVLIAIWIAHSCYELAIAVCCIVRLRKLKKVQGRTAVERLVD